MYLWKVLIPHSSIISESLKQEIIALISGYVILPEISAGYKSSSGLFIQEKVTPWLIICNREVIDKIVFKLRNHLDIESIIYWMESEFAYRFGEEVPATKKRYL